MPEGFTSLIYCALLSSRSSTATCTSPRSAVRIIVDCMRDEQGHASYDTLHQNAAGIHALHRRRETKPTGQAPFPFTPEDPPPRRGDVKVPRKAAGRYLEFARHSQVPSLCNAHHLSQLSLVRLANAQTLPIHHPVASIHSSARVSQSPNGTKSLQKHRRDALKQFRSSMTALKSNSGDMEQAWESFEILRTSGALSSLSDAVLICFAPLAYSSSRLSLDEPITASRDTAARLGRLHDEIQHRVESSTDLKEPVFRLWSNVLAIQTLVLAGKLENAMQILTESLVLSSGRVTPQQITSLQQLFLASTRQQSLEDGLAVLAKSWFWIHEHFSAHHQPVLDDEMKMAVEDLRGSVVFALGTIEEGSAFLQSVDDKAVQEVGASIFAFVYGAHHPADIIYAMYRDFVSRGLSMPLEAHLRFFAALLSKEAYSSARDVRKHILLQFPSKGTARELTAMLDLFPALGKPDLPGQDMLTHRVGSVARARFFSCIEGQPEPDLVQVWEDLEASDILRRVDGNKHLEIHDKDILAFARLVVDNSRFGAGNVPNSKELANTLDRVVEELNRRYSVKQRGQNVENPFARPALWHSLTLKGDLLTLCNMLVEDKSRMGFPDHIRAVTQLFLAALRLQTLQEAFRYLVILWSVVVRHLDDAQSRFTGEIGRESAELRNAIFSVFGDIEDPGAWITSMTDTPEAQNLAASVFFMLFRDRRDSDSAWQVFEDLRAQRLPVPYDAHLILMKTFIRDQTYDLANRVYSSLRELFPERTEDPEVRGKDELHMALRLSSLQGHVVQAEECFQVMEARGFVDRGVRRQLLHAHAVSGNTNRVNELFSQFFPREGPSPLKPEMRDFREAIYAHVRAGDLEGVNRWLDEMTVAKIRPDISMYNMILLAFATLADLESASAVLARMYENDLQPDRVSFTTVISIMADKKDPIAAEQLYQRALDEGVKPDDVMIMALMNAHVEAGSWKGVIRAFDYLSQSRPQSSRRLVQLYNTLLKAYVLIGAPFRVISDIFRRYERLKLRPTEYTYALVIQSACDAGRMDIARDFFLHLDDMQGPGKSPINAYIMTILMAGFLRKGDKERAKAVYDDMYARGIQPTSVTFGVVVHSYANERSEESLRIAEDFMHNLLSAEESQRAWIGSARGGRPKALEAVFGPLMSIYGRELDVAAVERQFDEMMKAGGEPTLVALTMLMDAYRRVDNIDGAKQVWTDIVEVALRDSQSDLFVHLPSQRRASPQPRAGLQRQANILCLSLSIYIDALSTAGLHVEIATTWRQVKAWGFTFDAHNWNHLAVALVRAGEVERAFEIVERVLVPYQVQTRRSVKARRRDPTTPLTFVSPDLEEPAGEESAPRSRARRRPQNVRSATRIQEELSPVYELDTDPAQPLHELQQLSLTWHGWRAHNVTLDALSAAMKRLEAGLRVLPARQAVRPEDDPRRMSPQEADAFYVRTRREVGEMLGRIYQNHPNAVGLVARREGELQRAWAAEEEAS